MMIAAALDPERFEAFMRGQPTVIARAPLSGRVETRATPPGAAGWREHLQAVAAR